MKNKLYYIIAAVVVVAALIVTGIVYVVQSNGYVAAVAGEKITKGEYMFFLSQVKQQMESTQTADAKSSIWTTKIDGKDATEVAKDRALDNAKEYKIQLIQAKKSNIILEKTDTDAINQSIDEMIKSNGGRAKTETDLKSTYGLTLEEYKSFYKNYTMIDKFMQKQEQELQPTEEDMKKYYDEDMEKPGEITTVRHILFLTKDADNKPFPEDKVQEIKKKADDMLAKLKNGEDVAALAKQYSEDPGSKDNGGIYTFGKGEMVKEFEDWAFNAKPGDTGVVKTEYGYHVIKKPAYADLKDIVSQGGKKYTYGRKLEEWKNDNQYNAIKNKKVFDTIKVV